MFGNLTEGKVLINDNDQSANQSYKTFNLKSLQLLYFLK